MEKTFAKLGGGMKQGLMEVLVSSAPASPLPSLPFQGADFTLIQRETKDGRAGEREKSPSAALSVPHGSWGGGVGEAESAAAYPKPPQRLSKVKFSQIFTMLSGLCSLLPTGFFPASSPPCPLLYVVNQEGDRF